MRVKDYLISLHGEKKGKKQGLYVVIIYKFINIILKDGRKKFI